MRFFILFITGFCLIGCRSTDLFEAREYRADGGKILEFYPDKSFRYLMRMEGGYIYEYGRGTWKQEGNKLFLLNEISNPSELPISIRTSLSNESETQLVVNILPKKNLHFAYLPGATDLLNIELVIDRITYPLKNETNIIRLQKHFDSGYFRAYPKAGVERSSEILNDTLRSQKVSFKDSENKILTIDVDCNPLYFAQVKMSNDILRVINKRKIKWNKIILERPQ
jgi:hypothetical protein